MKGKDVVGAKSIREPVLRTVDRVSELLFGLFMALTFVGAVSIARAGREEIQAMFAAALGCNLAWGPRQMIIMYLVRTITDRGRSLTLVRSVQAAPDAETGRSLIERSLAARSRSRIVDGARGIRARIVALSSLPEWPTLEWADLLAALAIFLIVVVSTFPVVLPFLLITDVAVAMTISHTIALAVLFLGGLALGRHAGYGSWKGGFMMAGLGAALVTAISALGG